MNVLGTFGGHGMGGGDTRAYYIGIVVNMISKRDTEGFRKQGWDHGNFATTHVEGVLAIKAIALQPMGFSFLKPKIRNLYNII